MLGTIIGHIPLIPDRLNPINAITVVPLLPNIRSSPVTQITPQCMNMITKAVGITLDHVVIRYPSHLLTHETLKTPRC